VLWIFALLLGGGVAAALIGLDRRMSGR
jgi:hypothetical protein